MASCEPARQTSVRVPNEALEALDDAAAKRSLSRDATLGELVAGYVELQYATDPEDRVTHLTTVLRYPKLPPGRGWPDPRAHLRLRLPDSLRTAAVEHAFLLPGQSPRHGHHDYAGRPLTDVVMTAIELAEPIQLARLGGLPSLVPRRTAMGLWRLTVAATLTTAERRAIWGRHSDVLAPVLTEEEVAWHHPWRFEVAETLLRNIHDQPVADVAENMEMLYHQTKAFRALLADVRRHDSATYWLLHNLPRLNNSVSGRGGAAVWRAKRKLALEAVGVWATNSTGKRHAKVTPPGWMLKLPDHWHIRSFTHTQTVPPALQNQAATGTVAVLVSGSRTAYWPLDATGTPIPGFDAILRAGRHLAPERLLEVVLHRLDYPHIGVPAEAARELAFITKLDRDALVAATDALNEQLLHSTLKRAESCLAMADYGELAGAAGNLKRFEQIAKSHYLPYRTRCPTWTWDVRSIPEALKAGHTPARLAWLTEMMGRITTRLLEEKMEVASREAFFLGRTPPTDTDL